MEQASKNRLQFVHCDTLFESREQAIAYVENIDAGQAYGRPSLYAEPMILKYGEEANPNIILAIGSVGDGVTKSTSNKTFFIDAAHIDESIETLAEMVNASVEDVAALRELVANVISGAGLNEDGSYKGYDNEIIAESESLADAINTLADFVVTLGQKTNFNVEDTNTVELTLEEAEDGDRTLTADVKLQESKSFDGRTLVSNQIVALENGLFLNVDLTCDGDGEPLQLWVNGEVVETIEMPKEVHVVEGTYLPESEEIILTLSDDTSFPIDVTKLAGEIIVDAPHRISPVELVLERVTSVTEDNEDVLYHSVLKAKVHVADDYEDNILEILDEGASDARLYVKGTADNIAYENGTVKSAIDSIVASASTETERAKAAESALAEQITTLDETASALGDAIETEIVNRETSESNLDSKIDEVKEYAESMSATCHTKEYEIKGLIESAEETLQDEIDAVDAHRTLKVKTPVSKNLTLTVDDSSENATYIDGYVNVLDSDDNIIVGGNENTGSPLYATTKLSYSNILNAITFETSGNRGGNSTSFYLNHADLEYDTTTNRLTYTYTFCDDLSGGTRAKKTIQLNSFGTIDHIDYDAESESLIIYYEDSSGTMQHIVVPVGNLVDQFDVNTTATIELRKVEATTSGSSDQLYADVRISSNDGNIISVRTDGLYVSNSAITANTAAIEGLESTVENHEGRIATLETATTEQGASITNLETSLAETNTNVENLSTKLDEEVENLTLQGTSGISVDYNAKTVGLKINTDLNTKYLSGSENGIYVSGIDEAIASATSGKANTEDVYSKTDADAKFATNESLSEVAERVSVAENEIEAIEASATALTERVSTNESAIAANKAAIDLLNANEATEGSVANDIKKAKDELTEAINASAEALTLNSTSGVSVDYTSKTVGLKINTDLNEEYLKGSENGIYVSGIDSKLAEKANADNVYTKEEVDSKLSILVTDAELEELEARVISNETSIAEVTNNVSALTEKVNTNTEAISTLNGDVHEAGSVAYAINEAKGDLTEALTLQSTSGISVDYNTKTVGLKINTDLNSKYLKGSENGVYVSGIDEAIASAVSGKANTDDVYSKTDADAKFATAADVDNIESRVDAAEESISQAQAAIVANASHIAENEASIATNKTAIDLLNANEATEGSVAYAVKNTLTEAKAYSDSVVESVKTEIEERISEDESILGSSVKTVTLNKSEESDLVYRLVYTLNNGETVTGGTVNIPKDKYLKSATYDSANKKLILVFVTSDGEVTTEIPLGDLVDTYVGDGETISIQENVISVKVCDHEHNEYLKVCDDGLYVGGVNEAIANAVDGLAKESDVYLRNEADNTFATKQELATLSTQVGTNASDIATLKSNVATVSGNVETAKESAISSAKTYTDSQVQSLSATVDTKITSAITDSNLSGSSTISIANKIVSLKINDDLNTEGYLKYNNNGVYVSGIDSAIGTSLNSAKSYTDEVADTKVDKTDFETLSNQVDANRTNIASNTTDISGLRQDLTTVSGTLQTEIESVSGTLKTEIDTKANAADVYTKEEVDEKIVDITSLRNDINAISGDVDTLKTTVQTNTENIATNTANISENASKIATNTEDIAANTASISENAANIATNTANISENAANIATNTENIAANAANIATNTANISENASKIATNTANIAAISGDVNTLKSDVQTNATNIADNTSKITAISGNVTTISGDVNTLKTSVQTNASNIEAISGNVRTISGDVNTLKSNVSSISDNVSIISGQVQTISGNVATVSGTANNALAMAQDIKLKYNWITNDTPTVSLIKSESTNSGFTLTANANISSTEGNALTADTSGLFVGLSSLEYSTAGNELTFTNANGGKTIITLNSIDVVKEIYYDGTTDELVFKYTVEGVVQETRISAAAFFKGIVGTSEGNVTVTTALTQTGESETQVSTAITANLDVNDIIDNTDTNITLTKVSSDVNKINANLDVNNIVNTGNSLTRYVQIEFKKTEDNKIQGYVGISTLPTNVLSADSENELYVSNNASNYICVYAGTTMTIQDAFAAIENEFKKYDNLYDIIGVNETDTSIEGYLTDTNYLVGKDSVVDALIALDNNLGKVSGRVDVISGDVTTLKSDVQTNAANIATNTENIATNAANIATNTENIATNTANIATNTENIATNAANIATNAANIATVSGDVASLEAEVDANTANIATISGDIETVKDSVSALTTSLETEISSREDADEFLSGAILDLQSKTALNAIDSDSVDLTITTTSDRTSEPTTIKADVKLSDSDDTEVTEESENSMNVLKIKSDGLFYDGSVDYGTF